MALLVNTWEVAKEMITNELQAKAEAKALRQARPVTNNERAAMRRAVEARYASIPDDEAPNAAYIAQKLEEVEQNEPKAAPLDEVLSVEDGDDYTLGTMVDVTGGLRVAEAKAKVGVPTTPEQLRRRHRAEANVWLYMSA
eukprot:3019970-Alexandrium_andersonii.AAC.1